MPNEAKPTPGLMSKELIYAEAGTVYHETGLTPRQLAEQRAELLAALKMWDAWLNRHDRDRNLDSIFYELHKERVDATYAAIAKAKSRK